MSFEGFWAVHLSSLFFTLFATTRATGASKCNVVCSDRCAPVYASIDAVVPLPFRDRYLMSALSRRLLRPPSRPKFIYVHIVALSRNALCYLLPWSVFRNACSCCSHRSVVYVSRVLWKTISFKT